MKSQSQALGTEGKEDTDRLLKATWVYVVKADGIPLSTTKSEDPTEEPSTLPR